MLKYCNGCKRNLEIDQFNSYKKSTCEECVNKRIKFDYCDKEFNSTNLTKHIKQIHSTYKKTNSTSEITLTDHLGVSTYADSLKNKNITFDKKHKDKLNKIFASNRILIDQIAKDTINQKEKGEFVNTLKELKDLNYFNEKICYTFKNNSLNKT